METKFDYLKDELRDSATIFYPNQGEILALGDSRVTIKVTSEMTNNQLGIYEICLAPGMLGAGLHYHRFTDETFIVTKGRLTIQLTDRELVAEEGSVIYVPRFTPHGFKNNSEEETRLMLLFNPGQNREGFFRGMKEILSAEQVNTQDFLKLYTKYDSFPVGPEVQLPRT